MKLPRPPDQVALLSGELVPLSEILFCGEQKVTSGPAVGAGAGSEFTNTG